MELAGLSQIFYLLLSFILTVLVIVFITPAMIHLGFTDVPTRRKLHKGAVPLVGGLALFFIVFVFALFLLTPSRASFGVIGACALLTLVGALDDRFGLSYKIRFFAQVIAALMVIFLMGNQLDSLGELYPSINVQPGAWAIPVTILGIVAIINAFNLIDGIDGLAAGLAMVCFAGIYMLVRGEVSAAVESILMVLLGSLIAYLIFNLNLFPKFTQKIFMGDAGSTLLGFLVVAFCIRYTQGSSDVFRPVTALWLVAVPLTDMFITFLRRIRRGKNPFKPDRTHIHHIFQRARYPKQVTLVVILSWAAALAIVGMMLDRLGVPDYWSFALFLSTVVLHGLFISYAWKISKMIFRRW